MSSKLPKLTAMFGLCALLVMPIAPAQAQSASELAFWQAANKHPSIATLELYLDTYPEGHFAPLAKVMIAQMKQAYKDKASQDAKQPQKQQPQKQQTKEQQTAPAIAGNPVATCDQLAADPEDASHKGNGVSFGELRNHAKEATEACLAAVKQSNNGKSNYQLYRAYIASGKVRVGVPYLLRASEQGNPLAVYHHARLLASGKGGLQKDMQKAVTLHLENAKRGNAMSAFAAGFYLIEGNGTQPDHPKALEFLLQAEKAGNPYVHERIGYLYHMGKIKNRSLDRALAYYRKAIKVNKFRTSLARKQLADLLLLHVTGSRPSKRAERMAYGYDNYREGMDHLAANANIGQLTAKEFEAFITDLLGDMALADKSLSNLAYSGKRNEREEKVYSDVLAKNQLLAERTLLAYARTFPNSVKARPRKAIRQDLQQIRDLGINARKKIRKFVNVQNWVTKQQKNGLGRKSLGEFCLKKTIRLKTNHVLLTVRNLCDRNLQVETTVAVKKNGNPYSRKIVHYNLRAKGAVTEKVSHRQLGLGRFKATESTLVCFPEHGIKRKGSNGASECNVARDLLKPAKDILAKTQHQQQAIIARLKQQ